MSANARLSPLFTWRTAVTDEEFGAAPREESRRKVSTSAMRHVALTLTLYMSEAGDSAYPGLDRLIRRTGLARSTVSAALTELVATMWLKKLRGGGRGRATVYRASVPETVRRSYSLRLAGEAETVRYSDENRTILGPHHASTTKSSQTTSASPPKPKPKKRDELWDALVEILRVEPETKGERGRWNKALAELREAGATADDLRLRSKEYRKRWPEVSLTPTALAANWGSLAPRQKTVPACGECGIGGGLHAADCPVVAPFTDADIERVAERIEEHR